MADHSLAVAATSRHRTPLVVKLLVASTFVVILNETILINAIPGLRDYFGVDLSTVQWLNTAFMLTMAAVIPLTGWFLQQVTTRTAYAIAMSVFIAGTVVAVIAPTFEILVVARIIQAAGTAVMIPLLMTTIMSAVDPSDRGRVMGQVTLVTATAPALGPPISGLVLQIGSWRYIFVVTLVVALLVGFFGVRLMPDIGQINSTPVSWVSVGLGATGLSTFVYGITRIGTDSGWTPAIFICIGLVLTAVFTWYQVQLGKRDMPLLDLRTLRYRPYAIGLLVLFVVPMAFFGSLLLVPLYLQDLRGLDELDAGLMVAPGALAMGLLGPQVGKLYDRFGARPMVSLGAGGVVAVMLGLGFITASTPYVVLIGAHIVLMSCLAVVLTPTFTLALGALPARLYSHGSSLLGSLQQVGAAIGTAALAVTMQQRSTAAAASGASESDAFITGLQAAFFLGAAMSVVALALTLKLPGGKPTQHAAAE